MCSELQIHFLHYDNHNNNNNNSIFMDGSISLWRIDSDSPLTLYSDQAVSFGDNFVKI